MTVPAVLRGARASPALMAVLGVVSIGVVLLGVFGLRVLLASGGSAVRVEAQPVPSVSVSRGATSLQGMGESAGGGEEGPGAEDGAVRGSRASPGGVVVDVVGQVRTPGVVSLPLGSRVRDAVSAAGGTLPGADLAAINSARVLVDGEQVRVPKPGEVPPVRAGSGDGGAGGATGASSALVDLNTADLAALDTLPGVGPVLAQRILDWRAEHQRFSTVDELGEVSGIGEKLLAQLRPKVTV